jgi:hypothetical protein
MKNEEGRRKKEEGRRKKEERRRRRKKEGGILGMRKRLLENIPESIAILL